MRRGDGGGRRELPLFIGLPAHACGLAARILLRNGAVNGLDIDGFVAALFG